MILTPLLRALRALQTRLGQCAEAVRLLMDEGAFMADVDNVVMEVGNVRMGLEDFQSALTAMFQRVADAIAGAGGGDSPALAQAVMDLQDMGARLRDLKGMVDAQPAPSPVPMPGP